MNAKNRETTVTRVIDICPSRFAETEHLMRNVAYKDIRDESKFSRETNGLESSCVAVLKCLDAVCQGNELSHRSLLSAVSRSFMQNFSCIIPN